MWGPSRANEYRETWKKPRHYSQLSLSSEIRTILCQQPFRGCVIKSLNVVCARSAPISLFILLQRARSAPLLRDGMVMGTGDQALLLQFSSISLSSLTVHGNQDPNTAAVGKAAWLQQSRSTDRPTGRPTDRWGDLQLLAVACLLSGMLAYMHARLPEPVFEPVCRQSDAGRRAGRLASQSAKSSASRREVRRAAVWS